MSASGVRHGTLTDVEFSGNGLYRLATGTNIDGQLRSLITRGAGRERGATRIPIQIEAQLAEWVSKKVAAVSHDDPFMTAMKFLQGVPLNRLKVPLVQMPREGNLISGLEWNAPGGTGEPGESPEQIARREFSEEADVTVLYAGGFLPEWLQFASGCYDEVQSISFALVTGKPTRTVEGARQWASIPLDTFPFWAKSQNQQGDPLCWLTPVYCPVDGKVLLAVGWLREQLLRDRISSVVPLPSIPEGYFVRYQDGQSTTCIPPTIVDPHHGWTTVRPLLNSVP